MRLERTDCASLDNYLGQPKTAEDRVWNQLAYPLLLGMLSAVTNTTFTMADVGYRSDLYTTVRWTTSRPKGNFPIAMYDEQ